MPPSGKIFEALFDIRPTNHSGVLDFAVSLRKTPVPVIPKLPKVELTKAVHRPVPKATLPSLPVPVVKPAPPSVALPPDIREEFEAELARAVDVRVELARVGGQLHSPRQQSRPRLYALRKKTQITNTAEDARQHHGLVEFWSPKLETPVGPLYPRSRLLTAGAIDLRSNDSPAGAQLESVLRHFQKPAKFSWRRLSGWRRPSRTVLAVTTASLLLVVVAYRGGLNFKNDIVQHGASAVNNLEQAKNNLDNLEFSKAAASFASAYQDFGATASTLNTLGANFLAIFSGIPGLGQVKTANDLASAGQYIAKAGQNMALAVSTLSKLDLQDETTPVVRLVGEFKQVLEYAQGNINKASKLLATVDISSLPADKQQAFIDFKTKVPDFQHYIGSAINYTDFLYNIIGETGTKRYLVLLQNNTELRATGGFPGTYALITFTNGKLGEIKVDDVYNIDGQIQENIIPPGPLQHITPNWGMRDANWFADFPTSAQKVEEMYRRDGGGNIDGVLTITPDVVGRIIDIVGPIAMPEYNLTLDSKNLIEELQSEVEYGANRVQPKTIVKDLEPRLFEALAKQGKDGWLKVFQVVMEALEQKHILAYFNQSALEQFALTNNIAGQIQLTPGDYLQVVFSNVKGSKTDAVIDNKFGLAVTAASDRIDHQLTISRQHNGGGLQYGFYNRPNPTYVRVYAPLGAVLDSIDGYSRVDYQSLLGHSDYNFKTDPDLKQIEATTTHPFSGVDSYEESGQTVFGFWLVLKPKESKTVTVNYHTAAGTNGYTLLWQKQSGTGAIPVSVVLDGQNIFSEDLSVDREIKSGVK